MSVSSSSQRKDVAVVDLEVSFSAMRAVTEVRVLPYPTRE
jgi:hypothetical protein